MLSVLRENPSFRRLWLAQVVSQFGDWLGRMAVLTLIGDLGGGLASAGIGALFGVELALRLMPPALLGPLAGPVADRLPRRWVMVAADVARAGVVLCLLFIREPQHLQWLYVLVFAQTSLSIFFESAKGAAVPSTVRKSDLPAAYALSAASWSVLLTLGTLAGGLVQSAVGTNGVFVVDAATYLVSAWLVTGLRLPAVPRHPEAFQWRDVLLLKDLRRGLAHAREKGVVPMVFAKTFWGPCGAFLALLSVAARVRFSEPGASSEDMAVAMGILWSARGLGTGVGPVLARRWFGSSDRTLRLQVSVGFLMGAAGYAFFALTPSLALGFVGVVFAHAGGSALWVGSTLGWQRRVDDAYQGRIYALEALSMTFAFAVAALGAGVAYDVTGSLSTALLGACALVVGTGTLWARWARRAWREITYAEPT